MPRVELTNMCMIWDRVNNKVLVQNRKKSWKGISFPGGHVEPGESIVESTIREIKEETGLDISDLEPCGVIHWYNDETQDRFLVFNFRTETFSGTLVESTEEGDMFWVDVEELPKMALAGGLGERLGMFFEKEYVEGFGVWNSGGSGEIRWL